MTKKIYRPTVLTLLGVATTLAVISWTAGFIMGRLPLLRQFVPVHFDSQGLPDRWLPVTYLLVLLPVWIQIVLALVFGAIASLLLYRTRPRTLTGAEDEVLKQERERMLVTAEAISLLCAIWVTFQGIAALRIVSVWQHWLGDLGDVYMQTFVVAIVLSVIVGIRASVNLRYLNPTFRKTEDAHWRLQGIYFNPQDPSLFVPLRSGVGWTLNFGRARAILFLVLFLMFGIAAPIVLMRILLGL
jgi:uncharacterized membrane protein